MKKNKKPVNDPKLAGRFTKAYKSTQKNATPNVDNPSDTPAQEKAQRKLGIET